MTKSNAMTIRKDDTLIATQKLSNGYWCVIELPARSSFIHTYHRVFRTEKLAETHMAEQYSDAEWSSAEEITQEAKDRQVEEEKYHYYYHDLFYMADEYSIAQNALIWISQNIDTVGGVQGPMQDEFNTNVYEFFNIRFATRRKFSEQEEQAFLLATKPSTCQLGGEE